MKRLFYLPHLSKGFLLTLLAFLSPAGRSLSYAGELMAVLSSDLEAYKEALEGFQETYGHPVPHTIVGKDTPSQIKEAKVIVTFGSKAALLPYPKGTTLIHCMAPNLPPHPKDVHPKDVHPKGQSNPPIQIQILPRAEALLGKLKELQPSMKKLAILWMSSSFEGYVDELNKVDAPLGLEINSLRLEELEELPNRLRRLKGQDDALWVLPDPALVNAQSFVTIKEFCLANRIPFYAPTAELTKKGAAASVSPSFQDIGRAAGETAKHILEGSPEKWVVYPAYMRITVNLSVMTNTGVLFSKEAISRADLVLP